MKYDMRDPKSLNLEEGVAALAVAKIIVAEFVAQNIPVPEDINEHVASLQSEVKSQRRDYLEHALRAAQARQAALKSREERAQDATAEIARIEAQLSQ